MSPSPEAKTAALTIDLGTCGCLRDHTVNGIHCPEHVCDKHQAIAALYDAAAAKPSAPTPKYTCAYCHKGMESGVTLLRVNKFGDTPAVWLCAEHFNYTDWKAAR